MIEVPLDNGYSADCADTYKAAQETRHEGIKQDEQKEEKDIDGPHGGRGPSGIKFRRQLPSPGARRYRTNATKDGQYSGGQRLVRCKYPSSKGPRNVPHRVTGAEFKIVGRIQVAHA